MTITVARRNRLLHRYPGRLMAAGVAVAITIGFVVIGQASRSLALTGSAGTGAFLRVPASGGGVRAISASTPRIPVNQLKMMNYYPTAAPWTKMWLQYDHAVVNADFARMSGLGANSVRIIVQPLGVGWPTVTAAGAAKLRDIIGVAAAHGLAVQLTLFDWWNAYSSAYSTQWLTSVLAPYRNDNRIALVEVQNEFPLSNPTAVSWSRAMLALLPARLPGVPRTISVSGMQDDAMFNALTRAIGPALLDVIDVHIYGSENSVIAKIAAAKSVAAGRAIFAGEIGIPGDPLNTSCSQSAQVSYYQRAALDLAQAGISGMAVWTLNDFWPSALPAMYKGTNQGRFGLRSTSGAWKFAAAAVTAMFVPKTPADELARVAAANLSGLSFDHGFDCDLRAASDNTGKDAWAVFDPADATAAGVQAGVGVNGTYAGYLRGTRGAAATKIPSLMHSFPSFSGRPVTLSARVRLVGATGSTRIAVAWFKGNIYLGTDHSGSASRSSAAWQQLSFTKTPPVGTTRFQVHLQSLSNKGIAYFESVSLHN